MRRVRLRSLLGSGVGVLMLALAQLATPVQAASGDCVTGGGQTTCTFTYTGAAQTWTVPADIHQATFKVYGAQGGFASISPFAPPGLGGSATATIAVTPGEAYQIMVGGQGGPGFKPTGGPFGSPLFDRTGGFNGGGNGGSNTDAENAGHDGGGGGGASDVRTGGFSPGERIIVAGGGGGTGDWFDAIGGAGGGEDGGAGGPGFVTTTGGGGGSQTSGGDGGIGLATSGGIDGTSSNS